MSSVPSSRQAGKPPAKTSTQDRPAETGQLVADCREGRGVRCDGRRLGRLRDGKLRIVCACGHSGDVAVTALVARHGEETRVRDAVALMRCGACGAQKIREVRWLD